MWRSVTFHLPARARSRQKMMKQAPRVRFSGFCGTMTPGITQEGGRPIRTNYHSHTTRCMHARGSDEDYAKAALAAGYSHLGFSDHSPWPYKNGYRSGMRMDLTELPAYLASVSALKARYAGQMALYAGLEAEYYPEYQAWLQELKAESLDFLILGSHFDRPGEDLYFGSVINRAQLRRYARHTIRGMESGLYDCLAHPELFLVNYPEYDADCAAISRDLCRAAKALNLPLEYNLSGFYPQSWRTGPGYPAPGFWEIAAKEGAPAIIGLDAHDPLRYGDTGVYDKAVKDLKALGLPLVEHLVKAPGRQAAG